MSSEGFIIWRIADDPKRNSLYAMPKHGGSPPGRVLLCSTVHMRLFVALDIEPQIRERIAAFMNEVRGLAPGVRWVQVESLHVTLKFIGEQPDAIAPDIEKVLRGVSAGAFQLSFRGTGFFPSEKSARVFWIGIEAEPRWPAWRRKSNACFCRWGSRLRSAHSVRI